MKKGIKFFIFLGILCFVPILFPSIFSELCMGVCALLGLASLGFYFILKVLYERI